MCMEGRHFLYKRWVLHWGESFGESSSKVRKALQFAAIGAIIPIHYVGLLVKLMLIDEFLDKFL